MAQTRTASRIRTGTEPNRISLVCHEDEGFVRTPGAGTAEAEECHTQITVPDQQQSGTAQRVSGSKQAVLS